VESLCQSCERLGFRKPTAIQTQSIPYALKGRDIIGLAQTGSGKTAAFVLPVLQALLETPQPFFACVLAPTRELAIQISEQFEALGAEIGLRSAVIVGGVDMVAQAVALSKRPHVVVATPGRLVDHLENTKGFNLKKLRYLVMDEADRLLNMDFGPEIDKILRVLPKEGRRTMLFSATMTSKVAKLQRASLQDPVRIDVTSSSSSAASGLDGDEGKYATVETLCQYYIFLPAKLKDCYFAWLLGNLAGQSMIIFVSTCATAQRLALLSRSLGYGAVPLHGQMPQAQRLSALNKFRAGERKILLATDVASRGLDIPQVDCVLNYDIPGHSKDYVHRVGRTARAGRSGKSISLVTQYDVEQYQRIEQLIGKKLAAYSVDKEQVAALQDRVYEANRQGLLQMKEEAEKKKDRGSNGRKRGARMAMVQGGEDNERLEFEE